VAREDHRNAFWRKVIGVVEKPIKLLPEKKLNANLEFCGDFAEAYQVGVEEAQGECLARIQELQRKLLAQRLPVAVAAPSNEKSASAENVSAAHSSLAPDAVTGSQSTSAGEQG
jgi:hypothetical protein